MGLTMTQKILKKASGKEELSPGELIMAQLDLVFGNDITAPVAIKELEKTGLNIFDRTRIALIPDHFTPNKDIKSAEQAKLVREFAIKNNIENYFEVGEVGIEHALIPEKGLAKPGDVIIGADSHTCTYGALGAFSTGIGSTDMAAGMATGKAWFKVPQAIRINFLNKPGKFISGKDIILHIIGLIGVNGALYKSMEFGGEGLKYLSMDDRFTIANMVIEAGAKNGIFEVDEQTTEYLREHCKNEYESFLADPDAEYERIIDIDLSKIENTVAFPHLPENTKTPSEWGNIPIDQVVIGSCTNGRLSDLEKAARLFEGRSVKKGVRVIIFPATQRIYLEALKSGILETFIKAGCVISAPTCGPCLGGHMGVLAKGERCVSTTNRNFVGRMGHTESEVYLASPEVAAASAIMGRLASPDELF